MCWWNNNTSLAWLSSWGNQWIKPLLVPWSIKAKTEFCAEEYILLTVTVNSGNQDVRRISRSLWLCHSFHTSDPPHMIYLSCPFQEWSSSYCIQIVLSVTLSCIPKAGALACAKSLSTIAVRDRVTTFTLCCQPASYVTSSPSLGHVMPLMSDGCLLAKDGWLMAPNLTERGKKKKKSQVDLDSFALSLLRWKQKLEEFHQKTRCIVSHGPL